MVREDHAAGQQQRSDHENEGIQLRQKMIMPCEVRKSRCDIPASRRRIAPLRRRVDAASSVSLSPGGRLFLYCIQAPEGI